MAFGALGQIARSSHANAEKAKTELVQHLSSDSPWVIATAVSTVADCKINSVNSKLVSLVSAENVHVRYEAAMACGTLGIAEGIDAVTALLTSNFDADPMIRHAGIMGLAGQKDLSQVVALKANPSVSVRIAAAVALRKRADSRVSEFLNDIDKRVSVEAARAIHDLIPLHAELPKLAAVLNSTGDNDALIRRCLNAHYRLGKPENAEAIGAFAGDDRRPEELRLEAVDMLLNWAKPGLLDRVINDYRPLPERSADPAKEALRTNLVRNRVGSKRPSHQGAGSSIETWNHRSLFRC